MTAVLAHCLGFCFIDPGFFPTEHVFDLFLFEWRMPDYFFGDFTNIWAARALVIVRAPYEVNCSDDDYLRCMDM